MIWVNIKYATLNGESIPLDNREIILTEKTEKSGKVNIKFISLIFITKISKSIQVKKFNKLNKKCKVFPHVLLIKKLYREQ